jgi:hypothetical protein
MVRTIPGLVVALSAIALGASAHAQTLASANFASYANGDLVGQNGWLQYNTSATAPIQVVNGAVTWTGNGTPGSTVNNQDAVLAFSQQVTQPAEGTTILNFDMLLSISSAGASPSYFAALNTLTTTTTSGNFQNVRMVAQASGSGFVFGTRVNGQTGYPLVYGTSVLNFNQTYALRAEVNLVAGNANDFISLYVGSSFNDLSLYGTAGYTTGTVADISVGAMLLSQFASGTAFESGVGIQSMSVSIVPAPGAVALLGVAGLAAGRRRRA